MTDFNQLLQQGTSSAWLFIPTAVVLGALHGLEPGHSKTMMAAFIIAVRGTIRQAVLLGLCAAFSHSLIIWLLAAVALKFGSRWNAETTEPYFQRASAAIIAGLALGMLWRTHRDVRAEAAHSHNPDHGHDHEHAGQEEHHHHHPHETGAEYEDAHQRAHGTEIEQRFANREVTTGQIMLFGLTGGLLPCPAAFSVLLICLQLKRFSLGFAMVLAFSLGLALTLVASGAAAAWSVRHASKRWSGFGTVARKLPYLSSAFLLLVALYVGYHGWRGLGH